MCQYVCSKHICLPVFSTFKPEPPTPTSHYFLQSIELNQIIFLTHAHDLPGKPNFHVLLTRSDQKINPDKSIQFPQILSRAD